jgi:predicted alpha/beta-hydrolase family hydrolase
MYMPDLNITSLSITGYDGAALPNRFFRQKGTANTLAVLFPGLRYSCDMPLLYYPFKLLLQRGAEVLQVRADYTQSAYSSLSLTGRGTWLAEDAQAAVQAARAQREYTRLVLIGKSIGTISLASLVLRERGAISIWLTPLLRNPQVVTAAEQNPGPALFVSGTADDLYHGEALERIRAATQAEMALIEGGDHSLEIAGDFFGSLCALEQVMRAVAGFLDRVGI